MVETHRPGPATVQRLTQGHVQVAGQTGVDRGLGHDLVVAHVTPLLRVQARDFFAIAGDDELTLVGNVVRSLQPAGDTFELGKFKVRLLGVNTPESVHPSQPVAWYGVEASKHLKKLLLGKKVRLEPEEGERLGTGAYNRVLAYPYLEDGTDVARKVVIEGYGRSYHKYPCKRRAEFDEDYFRTLCRSRYALCPAGDAPWSMRFFEAILCKSIPVVEHPRHTGRNSLEYGLGYRYHLARDFPFRNDQGWAEQNFETFVRNQTLLDLLRGRT